MGSCNKCGTQNPNVVDIFKTDDVKDLKRLQQELKINNAKKNTQGHTVHWTSGQGYSSCCVLATIPKRAARQGILLHSLG